MNPNLTLPAAAAPQFSFKDILMRKLYYAVTFSVLSQITLLVVYVFVVNINVFDPLEWFASALRTFTYVSTWLFVIVFLAIVFAQCLICSKDYVVMSTYCSTRFQKLLHILSAHNFLLLTLHVSVGGVLVWQLLSLVDGPYQDLVSMCRGRQYCLVPGAFYLILGSFWTGLYYFLKVYIASRHLTFPVLQQKKFCQFREHILVLFRNSFALSFWPALYFAVFYYVWGRGLEDRFMHTFGIAFRDGAVGLLAYLYAWGFSALYFFNMDLMRFFFHLFLTEKVEFPLVKTGPNVLTLQEAMLLNNMPIVRNLACLDLYLLSQWSPQRRQIFYQLSQPGEHPHNWNSLTESVLKLLKEYTDVFRQATENPPVQDAKKIVSSSDVLSPIASPISPIVQSPIVSPFASPLARQGLRYRNLRNMSMMSDYEDNGGIVDVSNQYDYYPRQSKEGGGQLFAKFLEPLKAKLDRFLSVLKILFGIEYLFGELPHVNIQKCLGQGQLVIWTSQGVAELVAKSLTEDSFGVVQKDLPVIITSLVQLKQCLDKMSKVPSLSRTLATLDRFNHNMKGAISAAVKRSLFNICLHFGDYLSELSLNKEVVQYLHANVMLKRP